MAIAIGGARFELYHGQDETIRFLIAGATGAVSASLFIGRGPTTLAADRDMVLTSGAGLTLSNLGLDLQIDAIFTNVAETLPTGYRHWEMWVTKGGHPKPVRTGVVLVHPSLAS